MSPSATPATQSASGCHQVPRLPRKSFMRDQGAPSEPPDPAQSHKCHACHAKRKSMSPSATLPRKVQVDVTKHHACHSKASRATKGPQACHQTQPNPISATPATQNEGRCHQVRHCHAKCKWMSLSTTPATQIKSAAAPRATKRPQGRHQTQSSPISATRATQNEDRCHKWMTPSATPATQKCRDVTRDQKKTSPVREAPRLPRKTKVDSVFASNLACSCSWEHEQPVPGTCSWKPCLGTCSGEPCLVTFFSSGLAVNALWHGPINTRTEVKREAVTNYHPPRTVQTAMVSTIWSITLTLQQVCTTTNNTKPKTGSRHATPPDRVARQHEENQHTKRGQAQQKPTPHKPAKYPVTRGWGAETHQKSLSQWCKQCTRQAVTGLHYNNQSAKSCTLQRRM